MNSEEIKELADKNGYYINLIQKKSSSTTNSGGGGNTISIKLISSNYFTKYLGNSTLNGTIDKNDENVWHCCNLDGVNDINKFYINKYFGFDSTAILHSRLVQNTTKNICNLETNSYKKYGYSYHYADITIYEENKTPYPSSKAFIYYVNSNSYSSNLPVFKYNDSYIKSLSYFYEFQTLDSSYISPIGYSLKFNFAPIFETA